MSIAKRKGVWYNRNKKRKEVLKWEHKEPIQQNLKNEVVALAEEKTAKEAKKKIKMLEQENAQLIKERDILEGATTFFATRQKQWEKR